MAGDGRDAGRLSRRVPLGVVTNCSVELGRRAAARCGVAFAVVVAAEEAGFYKPRPEPYQMVLGKLGTAPARTLFVAGSAADVPGAKGSRDAGLLAQSHGACGGGRCSARLHRPLIEATPGACLMLAPAGVSLTTLETPRLLLDLDRLERNCAAMRERCATLGVALRPHLKTAKSADVARIPGGRRRHHGLDAEGSRAFRGAGYRDILYAAAIVPDKFAHAARIQESGCDLILVTDAPMSRRRPRASRRSAASPSRS